MAEFNDDSEVDGIVNRFLNSACQHIDRHIARGSLKNSREIAVSEIDENFKDDNPSTILTPDEYGDDVFGFYDEVESATNSISRQAELLSDYSGIINDTTSEIHNIMSLYGDDQQKKRFDEIGLMLSKKSDEMYSSSIEMESLMDMHSRSFESFLLMLDEFIQEDSFDSVRELTDTLSATVTSMDSFLEATKSAKEATERSPRATQKFNQGKRKYAAAMSEMISITERSINRFREYVSYLEAFLNKNHNST